MKNNNKQISDERALSIILRPLTTEKSTNLNQYNSFYGTHNGKFSYKEKIDSKKI